MMTFGYFFLWIANLDKNKQKNEQTNTKKQNKKKLLCLLYSTEGRGFTWSPIDQF